MGEMDDLGAEFEKNNFDVFGHIYTDEFIFHLKIQNFIVNLMFVRFDAPVKIQVQGKCCTADMYPKAGCRIN